jgi:hypothetical protein
MGYPSVLCGAGTPKKGRTYRVPVAGSSLGAHLALVAGVGASTPLAALLSTGGKDRRVSRAGGISKVSRFSRDE